MEYRYESFERSVLREDMRFHQRTERLPVLDLPTTDGGRVQREDLRGKPVFLTFASFT